MRSGAGAIVRAAIIVTALVATGARAGPIVATTIAENGAAISKPATLGGYVMAGFLDPADPAAPAEPVNRAISLRGDSVAFTTRAGDPVLGSGPYGDRMQIGDRTAAPGTNANPGWWDGVDDGFYFTDLELSWLELVMPTGTPAFSLTIDAGIDANAWILAVDGDGIGYNTLGETFGPGGDFAFPVAADDVDFDVTLRRTPGIDRAEAYGFHVDAAAPGGACATIQRVIVDPNMAWAIGDFQISVDRDACASVPAPSAAMALGIGLLGLLCTRRWQVGPPRRAGDGARRGLKS